MRAAFSERVALEGPLRGGDPVVRPFATRLTSAPRSRFAQQVPTVKQLMSELPERFDPATAVGLNAVVQFNLSGDGGGSYHAIIKDGTIAVREGSHRSPDMTLAMAAPDYVELATGALSAQKAFLLGKLRIAGDMALAEKVQALIRIA